MLPVGTDCLLLENTRTFGAPFSLHHVPRTFFDAFPSPSKQISPRIYTWAKDIVADGVTVTLFTDEPPRTTGR